MNKGAILLLILRKRNSSFSFDEYAARELVNRFNAGDGERAFALLDYALHNIKENPQSLESAKVGNSTLYRTQALSLVVDNSNRVCLVRF